MGVEIPAGGVQTALRWRSSGDPEEMISTLGFLDRGVYADAQAVAVTVAAAASTTFTGAANLVSGWTFVGVTAYVYQDGGAAEVGESVVNIAGSGGSDSLPSNCALLVRKRTASAGRRATGRMFVPSALVPEAIVGNNGEIGSAALAGFQTRIDSFYDALTDEATGLEPALWHSLGGSSGTEVLPGDPITALVVDPKIATQRRRMRR